MIKVEVQGVNVLDVYNQLKAVLNQFKSFVDSDRAMDDKAPGMVDTPVQTVTAPVQTPVTAPVSQEVKKYTLPEIQAALAPLLDAGKAVELQQLMAQFGVQYLGEVPENRYPELVNAIRGLGARI